MVPFHLVNKALLAKWMYKWISERHTSWNVWTREKYECAQGDSLKKGLQGKSTSGPIKDILSLSQEDSLGLAMQALDFRWQINNGNSALFWEDIWFQGCKEKPLMIKFHKLYQISKWKNTQLSIFKDLWDCYDHEGDIFWQRSLRSWELESLQELSNIIHSCKINKKEDLIIWKINESPYTVNQGIDFISRSRESQIMPWSFIWNLKIPPKAIIFFVETSQENLAYKSLPA